MDILDEANKVVVEVQREWIYNFFQELPEHVKMLLALYSEALQAERDGTATDFQRHLVKVAPGILGDYGL